MRRVSVIIPTLNDPLIEKVVAGVLAQLDNDDELIVVGKDEQNRIPRSDRVRFLDSGQAVTAPVSRNLGIQAAQGHVLVFIDSDCIPQAGWLEGLLRRLAAGEDVVIGSVLSPTDNYWVLAYNISLFHEFMAFALPGPRRYLPTLNLAVRREVVTRVGLMDETLPRGQDIDWGIRMAQAGYRLYFEPSAAILHCPARTDPGTVWHYSVRTGRNLSRVRLRYADYYRTPAILANPTWVRLFSPLVAAYATSRIFLRAPTLWRYIHTFPAIYGTKIAWCLGAAQQAEETTLKETRNNPRDSVAIQDLQR
jgi:glycosyltransferase involved in cell wall biosynthesis